MTQHLAEVEVVDNIVSLDSSLIINYLYLYFKCTMGEKLHRLSVDM